MTSPHSFSFSKPAMPGDAVSVLILVEDSAQMAAKWPDVRDLYLPVLLENLRADDPSVQMEARWLTTSSSCPVATYPIMDTAQCRNIPDLALGQGHSSKISPMVIHQAVSILASVSRGTNSTRHFVLVAATGPPSSSPMTEATPSGFDPWDDIALVLKQEYIRLHVILNIGAEMRTYHELFKRSLQLQSNSEVPAWFQLDSRKYSIRLSGRPQYVRSSVAVPIPLIPTVPPQGHYGNPNSPPSKPVSPNTPPAQDSPPRSGSPHHRKSSTSPVSPRNRGRGSESSNSPPESGGGGGGLVSFLQQMHGLTKKKSYGVKAPKKTYVDAHLSMPGRPILPRLEVPPSDIYTYPSFDNAHSTDPQVLVSDSQLHSHSHPHPHPQPPPSRRHSADQLPPASLVARTSNEDRRARRRGPWLPIAPLVSSTPSSPTSVTSPGTLAALQSLASMTPRLPDFATKSRASPATTTGLAEAHSPLAMPGATSAEAHAYPHTVMTSRPTDMNSPYAAPQYAESHASAPPYYYSHGPESVPHWPQQGQPASPANAPSPSHTSASSYSDASRTFSDYTYGSSPPSSSSTSPPSIAALAAQPTENPEDQPFIMSPEWMANADAQMAEVVRSGELQANITPALHSAVQTMQPAMSSPAFVPAEPMVQEQMYYSAMQHAQGHPVSSQEVGYTVYQDEVRMGVKLAGPPIDGGWQYAPAQGYPVSGYVQQQGQWYPV
ncbi:hypothetical protein C8Q73DRAFT_643968 [Cubamyces lactineus]|nr:hypothetical protein C8Q73DRAFT_643968 [Cubamyces lactineus]